eukprot:2167467-Rhodomonas_salina.2
MKATPPASASIPAASWCCAKAPKKSGARFYTEMNGGRGMKHFNSWSVLRGDEECKYVRVLTLLHIVWSRSSTSACILEEG